MKGLKRILKYFALLIFIGLAGLFAYRPVLLKVLWYRTPDANTYKIFPQAWMRPADTPFHFIRAAVQRNDLDTLTVRDRSKKFIPLLDYLKQGKINLFMVIRHDTILYEEYRNGYSDSTLTTVFSIAKSMTSIALGCAINEGKIKNLDDHVTLYLPELKNNPAFADITIRHLLAMRSGLEFKETNGGILNALFSDEAKYFYTGNMKRELTELKLVNTPGTVWKYKSVDAILLGWIIERAAGMPIAEYFQERIWRKIGTEYPGNWGLDNNGLANTASRFQCTAIDIAKIGKLFLQMGKFGSSQVIPEKWVRSSTNVGREQLPAVKGWQHSAQHYLWWLPQTPEHGDFSAEGMLGQRLYVDPETNTIIVQFAEKGGGDFPYRKISRYLSKIYFNYPPN